LRAILVFVRLSRWARIYGVEAVASLPPDRDRGPRLVVVTINIVSAILVERKEKCVQRLPGLTSVWHSTFLPERLRTIGGQSFAFIPHRFLRDGFLASLTADERSLYLFLVLAADRRGVSFYSYDRICTCLEMILEQYLDARNALIDKDLIAFDGTRFQVLFLPMSP